MIANNTIFLQVEKESAIYLFRYLQSIDDSNVFYKPSRSDLSLYWKKDSIIIADLVTESPRRLDEPHFITIEKILVDMIADKLISSTYSKAEYEEVIKDADNKYYLDKTRMFRYARRRNKEDIIKAAFLGAAKENYYKQTN